MASRKVVQITLAAAPAVESQHEAFESVVALCDDGTMWYRDLTAPPARLVWTEIPNVPQPAQEATV